MNETEFEIMLEDLELLHAEQFERLCSRMAEVATAAAEGSTDPAWGEAVGHLRNASAAVHGRLRN